MSAVNRLFGNIYFFFSRHQALKSATITGALMGGGDFISQTVIERTKKYSYVRTARFVSIGFFFIGPVLYKWYGILERVKFKSTASTALARMVVDQTTIAPSFLFLFFWINGTLQGLSSATIKHNLRRDYTDVLLANYQLWPATQLINFSLVPLAHRILFAQTVALFWNTYLAWKFNQEDPHFEELKKP